MLKKLNNLTKQEKFDIIMIIVALTAFFCMFAWLAVRMLEPQKGGCRYVSRYNNTLQADIHRRLVCEEP